jgi:segregation and condensation protein A
MQRPPDALTDIIPPREGEFRIQLPAFEGPLDLLLHLCKKHELDILDLPVSFVTEKYLEYLKLMEQLDLDVAAEYLLMAATLAHIKSKMLLPRTPEEQHDDGELGEPSDPRADLIRRLLEYQKYKAAAESLGSRAITGRDVFPRGSSAAEAEGPAPLADIGTFKLLDAFEAILRRTKDKAAFEITTERISIQERMTQISDLLRARGTCTFEALFEQDVTRYEVVITFLALLEMTKMRLTRIYQAEYGASIHIQHALLDPSAPTIPPEREPSSAGAQAAPASEAARAPEAAAQAEEEEPGEPELPADFEALVGEDIDDEELAELANAEREIDETHAELEALVDEGLGDRPDEEIGALQSAERELDEARDRVEERAGDLVDEAIEDLNSTEHEIEAMLERGGEHQLEREGDGAREEAPREEARTTEPDEGDESAP